VYQKYIVSYGRNTEFGGGEKFPESKTLPFFSASVI
jgi:hypothetical protein